MMECVLHHCNIMYKKNVVLVAKIDFRRQKKYKRWFRLHNSHSKQTPPITQANKKMMFYRHMILDAEFVKKPPPDTKPHSNYICCLLCGARGGSMAKGAVSPID